MAANLLDITKWRTGRDVLVVALFFHQASCVLVMQRAAIDHGFGLYYFVQYQSILLFLCDTKEAVKRRAQE